MKFLMALFLFLLLVTTVLQAQEVEHGAIIKNADGKLQAWNDSANQWTDIEVFWLDFAKTNDAKYWGQTDTYPNYADVQEFDTVLIQGKQGSCLMQFFHSRWRRANDVQRWHESFNQYAGCAFVFD